MQKNHHFYFIAANSLHFSLLLQVSRRGRRYNGDPANLSRIHGALPASQKPGSASPKRHRGHLCLTRTHRFSSHSLSLPSPRRKERPWRLWPPQPVPYARCLWGQAQFCLWRPERVRPAACCPQSQVFPPALRPNSTWNDSWVWPKKGLQCVALREILKIAVPQLN